MRSAFNRAVALGCVLALVSLAQQQLPVGKLVQFIVSSISQKLPDKEVATYLASIKLSEKLDSRTVEELQGRGAGPKTVAALNRLAEASGNLPAPAPQAVAAKPKLPPEPSAEDKQKILQAAREYALNYSKSLPDFICLQITHRYYDRNYKPGTDGSWAISDRLAEKLSYFDQREKYEPISQNDNSLYGVPQAVGGALSRGDFGSILKDIFEPETRAEFRWERWGNLDKHLFHVYAYSVDAPHSKETIDYNRSQQVTPGYHGEIFIEPGTNVIWRITIDPEPPVNFPVQNIHEFLDYRYTEISGQKYMLPAVGQVIMKADGVGKKNDIEFRSYRKYSADTSITFVDTDEPSSPADANPDAPKK